MTDAAVAGKSGLLERLATGPVICAEGYLFEIERRGYLSAGAYVPEAVLDHPDVVAQLHRDFLHAGSDVMLAFTYYAHREKLRVIGREDTLEEMNRTALRLAREAAAGSDALVAGNVCNSNIFVDGDPESAREVRAMFDEQVDWAVDEGVDFFVAETISFVSEALLALDAIKASGLPRGRQPRRPPRPALAGGIEPGRGGQAPGRRGRRRGWAQLRARPRVHAAAAGLHPGGGELPRRGAAGGLPHHR